VLIKSLDHLLCAYTQPIVLRIRVLTKSPDHLLCTYTQFVVLRESLYAN
jgi:hypothetical protein